MSAGAAPVGVAHIGAAHIAAAPIGIAQSGAPRTGAYQVNFFVGPPGRTLGGLTRDQDGIFNKICQPYIMLGQGCA